jgi:hypothetical protein
MERLDKDRKKIKSPELDQEYALLDQCKKLLEENQVFLAVQQMAIGRSSLQTPQATLQVDI